MRFLIVRKGDEDKPYGTLEDINFETFTELEMFIRGMGGEPKSSQTLMMIMVAEVCHSFAR